MSQFAAAFCLFVLQSYLTFSRGTYISRQIGGDVRHCIRYHDCPPGNEIHVCKDDYGRDTCEPCINKTYIQPEYVSSTENVRLTKCFIPKGRCMAHDLVDSRSKTAKMCQHVNFCKCNKNECYFGDPCACNLRTEPCQAGETMNEEGECEKCPIGTTKDEPGCGPCRYTGETAKTKRTSTVQYHTTTSFPPLKSKIDNPASVAQIMDSTTTSMKHTIQNDKENRTDSHLMIGVVVLAALVILAIVLILCLLRHKGKHLEDRDNLERGPLMNQMPQIDHNNDVPCVGQIGNRDTINVTTNDIQNKKINHPDVKSINKKLNTEFPGSGSRNECCSECELPELISEIFYEKEKDLLTECNPHIEENRQNPNYMGNTEDVVKNNLGLNNAPAYGKEQQGKNGEQTCCQVIQNVFNKLETNVASFNDCTILGHTQVTEDQFRPVAQPSDKDEVGGIHQHRGPPSSGYGTQEDSVPPNSPMSIIENSKTGQEYQHLVSVSERNTESISSNLECYNHSLVGQNVQNSHT